eukprot:5209504-Heterocapsa_arctica.AAC.1
MVQVCHKGRLGQPGCSQGGRDGIPNKFPRFVDVFRQDGGPGESLRNEGLPWHVKPESPRGGEPDEAVDPFVLAPEFLRGAAGVHDSGQP